MVGIKGNRWFDDCRRIALGFLSQSLRDLLAGLAIAVIVHSLEGSSIALAIHSLDPSLSAQLIAPLIPPYKKVKECVGDGGH